MEMQDQSKNESVQLTGNLVKKCKHVPIIIILAILAVGGLGFSGYEFWLNTQKDKEIKSLQAKTDKSENCENCENKETQSSGVQSKADEAQDNYWKNLAKNYNGGVFAYYNDQAFSASIKDGYLTVKALGKSSAGDVLFEADGYAGVYSVKTGDGSVPHFYLIALDGTVSRIDVADGNYEPKKLAEYSKIVSVSEGGDLYAWLIDADGNIYKDAGM